MLTLLQCCAVQAASCLYSLRLYAIWKWLLRCWSCKACGMQASVSASTLTWASSTTPPQASTVRVLSPAVICAHYLSRPLFPRELSL